MSPRPSPSRSLAGPLGLALVPVLALAALTPGSGAFADAPSPDADGPAPAAAAPTLWSAGLPACEPLPPDAVEASGAMEAGVGGEREVGEARREIERVWAAFRSDVLRGAWDAAAGHFHQAQHAGARSGDGDYARMRAALFGEEEDHDPFVALLELGLGLILEDHEEGDLDMVLLGIHLPEAAVGGTAETEDKATAGPGEAVLVWELREGGDPERGITVQLLRARWEGTRWALLLPSPLACTLDVDFPLPPLTADPSAESAGMEEARALLEAVVEALEAEAWDDLSRLADPEQRRWVEAERDLGLSEGWDMTWDFHPEGLPEEALREADGTRLLAWRLEGERLLALPVLQQARAFRGVALVGRAAEGDGGGALLYRATVPGMGSLGGGQGAQSHDVLEVLPVWRRGGVLHFRVPSVLAFPPAM